MRVFLINWATAVNTAIFFYALFENAILKPSTCVAGFITYRMLIFNKVQRRCRRKQMRIYINCYCCYSTGGFWWTSFSLSLCDQYTWLTHDQSVIDNDRHFFNITHINIAWAIRNSPKYFKDFNIVKTF
jgi:hypothetical protein